MNPTLVWFRHDLRLTDQPALQAAVARGGSIIPVFIGSPEEEGEWAPGNASKWWLHHSLAALAKELASAGSPLILRRGPTRETLQALIEETGADAVYWGRRYEPAVVARDAQIRSTLSKAGIATQSFNSALLLEPGEIRNKSGNPFQVFTPFWKHCSSLLNSVEITPNVQSLPGPEKPVRSESLASLELEPPLDWAAGLRAAWHPGEVGALRNLNAFVENLVWDYTEARNRPDHPGTSRLSPHLHFGEISPRQVWIALAQAAASSQPPKLDWKTSQFLTEIGWREFAHHLLRHFPHTTAHPLREAFNGFPWRQNEDGLRAWQRGETGYPIVDAGMRELWRTGWMHNRVRMITASFLVKDLLIPWQEGAAWFWDTLVDADLAANTLGWQWTAGCGADAAPYFRVFNPVSQGEKFDPHGDYVREYIPALGRLTPDWIHQPWKAPEHVLTHAGIKLGHDYPHPIVNHHIARQVALDAYQRMKNPTIPTA